MQRNKTRDIIIVGFALFAIFFGAGNLIFPPFLGAMAGEGWGTAAAGFLTTDPVFPILGVIATAMVGGMADDMGKRVGHWFAVLIGTISILAIGPFFCVPRTAATTHEVFTVPIFGVGMDDLVPRLITSVIFFGLTLFLVINQSKVIDRIGKFLTPVLLIILVGTIIVALTRPSGEMVPSPGIEHGLFDNLYQKGFTEGYQTMDALGAALMSGIVVTDLLNKGYKNDKERFHVTCGVGIVAGILLVIVYGGLTFVGATLSGNADFQEMILADNRTGILVGVFSTMFGPIGKWAIGIAVALACLTTSVGLISTAGNFFSRIFHKEDDDKFYKTIVIVATIISFFLSLFGVYQLVLYAVPVLSAIYPIYMTLFVYTLFDNKIKYNMTYIGAVVGAAVISIPKGVITYFAMHELTMPGFLGSYGEVISNIPLADLDFNWILPAIICSIIFTIIGAVGHVGKTREEQ